ncbi:hypothetical protein [Desulfosporosinus fructosivorans]
MQTTMNLGLKKPEGTDVVNIQDFNDNADLLDNYAATTETLIGTKAPLTSPALIGTPTAPTAALDTSTTQVATTAFVLGQVGTTAPVMNGTAGVGISKRYARSDHVHPVDTSRARQVELAAHLEESATETVKGHVEFATIAETATGTDATRGVHTAGLKAETDKLIRHSLATALSDFLVASGAGVFVKKTLAEVKTILGLGTAAYTASTAYATAAQGTLATNAIPTSQKGAANGVATLDASGKLVQNNEMWIKIAEQTLATSLAQVDFSSIPSGYRFFKITFETRSTSSSIDVQIRFNDDSSAIYDTRKIELSSVIASTLYSNQSGIFLEDAIPSSGSDFSYAEVVVSNTPTRKKMVNSTYSSLDTMKLAISSWENITNEINKITVKSSHATYIFSAGSTFRLEGCK